LHQKEAFHVESDEADHHLGARSDPGQRGPRRRQRPRGRRKAEGKFTQAFDNYVDLPDRVNVPLRKYARISDTEIETAYEYENEHPSLVIVTDATIVKGMNILRGMEKGGTLVVATDRKPEDILKFIPNKDLLSKIVCVNAKAICGEQTIDFSGTEGGVDAVGLGAGISSAILGAVAKAPAS